MRNGQSAEDEDRRRICRERIVLIAERVRHVNRVKGLLFAQGISGYEPLRKDRRKRLEERLTGDGRGYATSRDRHSALVCGSGRVKWRTVEEDRNRGARAQTADRALEVCHCGRVHRGGCHEDRMTAGHRSNPEIFQD